MTADAADQGAAYENPLMPNARLRQIYLAMIQARTLAHALPRRRGGRSTTGLEACLVSPSIDLGPGDLVSDALAGGVVDFLRGAALHEVLRPGSVQRRRGVRADCGGARRLPDSPAVADRIAIALGAAAALRALAAHAKGKPVESTAPQPGVAVVYVQPNEIPPALWRKSLIFARENLLPVLFVVLPAPPVKGSSTMDCVSAIALRCGVPGIPVDQDDAVAIYRVAQESIGHARIGGGPALMECVPFVIRATPTRSAAAADAILSLEQYILQRGVASRTWMDRQSRLFVERVATAKSTSR